MIKRYKFELENGVRVLIEPVNYVQSVAVGLTCNTGSRNELYDEEGITHLIEHMVFKGTPKRTAKEVAQEIEGRGGALNAYTDKENTCYYFRALAEDVEIGVDVISDIVLNPLIDPSELEKEKGVVLEEIKRSQDDPADYVHQLYFSELWGNHPLGKPIIGTPESVSLFKAENLKQYMKRQYRSENIIIAVAGNVDPYKFKDLAEEKLSKFQRGATPTHESKPIGIQHKKELSKDTEQVNFCIGTDAPSAYDLDDLYTMSVLDGILGGGMSSRLFQEIREKRGLVYSISSYNISYSSGGSFCVYGGTSIENWQAVQEIIRKEFDKLLKGDLSEEEIQMVKNNLCGHLVLGLEGMSARMGRMTRQEMLYKKEIPIEETLQKIKSVTRDQVIHLANNILAENCISTTAIGPF